MIIVYVNNQILVVSLERSCDIYGLHTVWKNHGFPCQVLVIEKFQPGVFMDNCAREPNGWPDFFFRPKVSLFQGLIIPKCYDCESLFRRYFSSTCYLIIPNRWYQKPTEACKSAPKYFRRYELIHGYGSKGLPVLPPTVDQLHFSEVFLRSNQFWS